MNNSEPRSLLEDLFVDEEAEQFRAAAMSSMLGEVRHKRRLRKIQRVALVLMLLAAVPLAWWLTQLATPVSPVPVSRPLPYEWVTTQALPAECVVRTRVGSCSVIATQTDGCAAIQSENYRRFVHELDDEGLLSFFAGRSVALVRRGPDVAELIVTDESLHHGFQLQ